MVLEVAALRVRAGQGAAFEAAFREAQALIAAYDPFPEVEYYTLLFDGAA